MEKIAKFVENDDLSFDTSVKKTNPNYSKKDAIKKTSEDIVDIVLRYSMYIKYLRVMLLYIFYS